MAIYSPLRLRRSIAQQAEARQRLITFQLQDETFALPLDRVVKVTTLERLYGNTEAICGLLTIYQGREIAAIDVGAKIFGQPPMVIPDLTTDLNPDLVTYLAVLQAENDRLIGLPIDSRPSIQSIAISTFMPILEPISLQCVKSRSVRSSAPDEPITADRASIYLLDTFLLTRI